MKTTIEIPEPLYRRAKIRAIERRQSLKQVVLDALQRELETTGLGAEKQKSFWKRRKELPEFEAARKAGSFRPSSGERDITKLISDDRNAR